MFKQFEAHFKSKLSDLKQTGIIVEYDLTVGINCVLRILP